jgi:mannose-6-phosphate isomerase-like protein (cupin superfamily)
MHIALAADEGRRFSIGPDQVTVKGVSPGDGGFAVVDYRAAPGVPGPPVHVHADIDEAWYLLDGTLDVLVGDERRRVEPGGFVLVPASVPHGFANAGSGWARWIGILSPGTALTMLEELGALMPEDGAPDVDAVVAMLAGYRTAVVGPPLASGAA